MDILTPRGVASRQWEDRAVQLWSSQWPDISYVETPKDQPAIVDAVLVKNNKIIGVVETKCRPSLSLVDFKVTHNMKWLVTAEKVDKAQKVAEAMCVPFVGFLYLPDQDILLYQSIWKPAHGWVVGIERKNTKTQATINGGKIWRHNAYIDMTNAKMIMGS